MVIKNGLVFEKEGKFVSKDLKISGKYIERFESKDSDNEVIDAKNCYVIPGLTDIHFHACVGYDFCDGTFESLKAISEYELSNGITTICPASMTFDEEKLSHVFRNAAEFENENGATLVGINMEGPFISYEKKGAQNSDFICNADYEMFERLQKSSGGLIKLVDIAPEMEGAMEFVDKAHNKVRISLAHTAADYETAREAFKRGAKHVTHLYNAMMPYTHREPGVIGAACDNENVMVEIIADGVHIYPAAVRTTFKMFGSDRIILISDTMEACGMPDGKYSLGGQDVYVKGNLATLKDGTIAGSVTNLMDCLRIVVKEMHIPLEEAVKCATVNSTKAIGVFDKYGSLDVGKIADIVILDEELNIKYIVKNGILKYN